MRNPVRTRAAARRGVNRRAMGLVMQVTVPDGVVGGQTIEVATPSGPMQAVVPDGLKGGDNFALPVPDVKRKVPDAVRRGELVSNTEAEAYCAALPHNKTRAADYTGCRTVTCLDCCSCVPCCCVYGVNPCGDCLCFPAICLFGLIPIPLGPLVSSCERSMNQWITRGSSEGGSKQNSAWVIVDEEKKTLAIYPTGCCSEQLQPAPMCYCHLTEWQPEWQKSARVQEDPPSKHGA